MDNGTICKVRMMGFILCMTINSKGDVVSMYRQPGCRNSVQTNEIVEEGPIRVVAVENVTGRDCSV